MIRITRYLQRLRENIKRDRKAFLVYSILRILVIIILVRSLMTGNYESAAICVLSLLLFLIPSFFETSLQIEIPTVFEIFIFGFIFAAEILGEINHYYVLIPGWDTMLHTLNGFLAAAVGFSLIYILNRKSENIELSPFYLALVAFCFSMTIAVLWEFFEFGMDQIFLTDMQKDFVVNQFGTVNFDPNGAGTVVRVTDIVESTIVTGNGESYVVNGYLDIGILDTMKDMLVNFVGAIVFSIFGYLYLKNMESGKSNLINKWLIRPRDNKGETANQEKFISESTKTNNTNKKSSDKS